MNEMPQESPKANGDKLNWLQQFFILLLGLFGLLLLWSSTVEVFESVRLLGFGLKTVGVVTDHSQEISTPSSGRDRGPHTYYHAIVSIETKNGTAKIRATTLYGSTLVLPLGSQVEVLYPPGHPENGRIKSETMSFWLPAITGVIGGFCLGGTIFIMLSTGTWRLPRRHQ